MLQAFIDDSRSPGNGTFVLGGHIASAEAWAAFSKDWENLLSSWGLLGKNGQRYFKMSEMASSRGRMEKVGAFYKVIEDHALASISCRFKIIDLLRVKNRIYIHNANIEWGFLRNPYLFAVRALLDMFHGHKSKLSNVIPVHETVDFIFDEQSKKNTILLAWDNYIANRPDEIRGLFGVRPKFEDDCKFLPLQGADLWAWWIRKWSDEGTVERNLQNPEFGLWGKGLFIV